MPRTVCSLPLPPIVAKRRDVANRHGAPQTVASSFVAARACRTHTGRALGTHHTPVGLIRVRDHCTFTWRGPEDERTVEIEAHHCADCIADVRTRGYRLIEIQQSAQTAERDRQ
jgi:hypothetical protein